MRNTIFGWTFEIGTRGRLSLALSVFILITANTSAQTNSRAVNQIGFDMGGNFGYFRDLNFSTLNFRERGLLFSLDYVYKNKTQKLLFTADVDYSSGRLKSEASDFFTTEYLLANLELSGLFKLRTHNPDKFISYVGPQYNTFFQYAQWGDDRDNWTYLMAHGLNIKWLGAFQLTARRSLQTSLSIPLLTNLVRPPYNGFDQYIVEHENEVAHLSFRGKTATFNKYIAFDWKTRYQYNLSERVGLAFNYLLRYQYVAGDNNVKHLQNQLTAGITVKW